jgi:hypothetical protein
VRIGSESHHSTRGEEQLAVFMEMEMPVTPDQYDAVDAALDPKGDPPDGLIAPHGSF